MSMSVVTILQALLVFVIYFGMTVMLPALIFHEKLKNEYIGVRLLAYLTIGNFYIINLVLILQLLHISNRFTLFLFTVLPAGIAAVKINRWNMQQLAGGAVSDVRHFLEGTMGFKLLISKMCKGVVNEVKRAFRSAAQSMQKDFLNGVGIVFSIVLVLRLYGVNLVETFGYCASDIPVHNYWINELGNNNIFVAGIYPFGFHCMIYYIHALFGVKTFVLLRVFCIVQTLMVHIVLLTFLKIFCKTRYMPYLAFTLYALAGFWKQDVMKRFCSSLPQEFGMMFILPAAVFLMLFFAERKKEKGVKKIRVYSTWHLALFAMNCSMTFAVHFYNTMILGLFCIAIAAGYLYLLFRRAYFWRILAAGIFSMLVAVLPMGIAYAGGTPLQGSLHWGMGIIEGVSEQPESPEPPETPEGTGVSEEETPESPEPPETPEGTGVSEEETPESPEETGASESSEAMESTEASESSEILEETGTSEVLEGTALPPAITAAKARAGQYLPASAANRFAQISADPAAIMEELPEVIREYVMDGADLTVVLGALASLALLFVLGIVFFWIKKCREYGCVLISAAVFVVLLLVLLMSRTIGIPSLMEPERCSIYLAYAWVAAVTLCADAVIRMVFVFLPDKKITRQLMQLLSLSLAVTATVLVVVWGMTAEPIRVEGLETNGAMTCLTNILREEKKEQFTVCSANDEIRMVEEYGYHVESIIFLRMMEGNGVQKYWKIPTKHIYFFIEKVPGDYTESYEGSGRPVSEEGAANALPWDDGFAVYKGEKRYIVMSRMYYWAQEFQKLYPTEMRVYYETDDFICYVLEQNPYRLFDLAIDYGFNMQ